MLSLEALILFDMLVAHRRTLAQTLALAPDRDSERAVATRHGYLVAQADLFRALHKLTPGRCLQFSHGGGVAADSEGGLHWNLGTRRLMVRECPFSAS